DPLYRRSIKVGMGAVFSTPWTRLPDWYDALPSLSAAGFTTVALTLADDATAIEDAVVASTGSRSSSAPRDMACRLAGNAPPTDARSSRCAKGSTPSTSPLPRPSPATSPLGAEGCTVWSPTAGDQPRNLRLVTKRRSRAG